VPQASHHPASWITFRPGRLELKKSKERVVKQIIRPTGLLDPEVEVRPADRQLDDLLGEIRSRSAAPSAS
jgi:excinuclease ABC subunit B